jgi:hypothetical protein
VDSAEFGVPALMKLITTFPLERYDIPAIGLRMQPRASETRQSYYSVALAPRMCGADEAPG